MLLVKRWWTLEKDSLHFCLIFLILLLKLKSDNEKESFGFWQVLDLCVQGHKWVWLWVRENFIIEQGDFFILQQLKIWSCMSFPVSFVKLNLVHVQSLTFVRASVIVWWVWTFFEKERSLRRRILELERFPWFRDLSHSC